MAPRKLLAVEAPAPPDPKKTAAAKAAAKTDDLKKKLTELIAKKQKPAQDKLVAAKEALDKALVDATVAEDERIRSLFLLAV